MNCNRLRRGFVHYDKTGYLIIDEIQLNYDEVLKANASEAAIMYHMNGLMCI